MMNRFLKSYLLTLLPFIALDALWLGLIAPGFYRAQIGFIMGATPNWTAAVLFYALFIAGMAFFVTAPETATGNWKTAALRGAFFGLVTYATYDLTNQATLAGWPALVTIVDMAWGTFLGAATASSATWLGQKMPA